MTVTTTTVTAIGAATIPIAWVIQHVQSTEISCTDGLDNDQDGDTDCFDADCSTQCLVENCTDGIDNDLNGEVDCTDFDCLTGSACAASGGSCTPSGSPTALLNGSVVTFDSLGWIDLQPGTTLLTAFETPSATSLTDCDYIEAMIAGTETQFANGWYFEQINFSGLVEGVGPATYSFTTGDAIAWNLSNGAENGLLELTGSITLSSFDSGAGEMVIAGMSLTDSGNTVTGTNVTACLCPNLDPMWLQGLVTN